MNFATLLLSNKFSSCKPKDKKIPHKNVPFVLNPPPPPPLQPCHPLRKEFPLRVPYQMEGVYKDFNHFYEIFFLTVVFVVVVVYFLKEFCSSQFIM